MADAAAVVAGLVTGYRVIRGSHAQNTAAERYRAAIQKALKSITFARGEATAEAEATALDQPAAEAITGQAALVARPIAFPSPLRRVVGRVGDLKAASTVP
ncbi:hypothetical protein [Kineosporia babensis]|uniref:Uncharacterized protein n=1 Tax=Kineosporia babensis TaxID=499548 RepID=A0A9X1SVX2_9ACTN|nr:hypothetical protein [Kineosporia babensis]MCD5314109.1 hypothetical protein [Kineosporia babensis]